MRGLSAIIIICILTSCTTAKPIPIAYDCPVLELPPDPVPLMKPLTDKSRPDEVVKFWVTRAKQYYDWNQVVHIQVDTSK